MTVQVFWIVSEGQSWHLVFCAWSCLLWFHVTQDKVLQRSRLEEECRHRKPPDIGDREISAFWLLPLRFKSFQSLPHHCLMRNSETPIGIDYSIMYLLIFIEFYWLNVICTKKNCVSRLRRRRLEAELETKCKPQEQAEAEACLNCLWLLDVLFFFKLFYIVWICLDSSYWMSPLSLSSSFC